MTAATPEEATPFGEVAFPPAPWHLSGHMTVLLWRVPVGLVSGRVPVGTRPVSMGGSSMLGTAWVHYEPGSMVAYDELLSAVHVHHGRAVRQTITDIWVDNPVSVAGGRALWGIPKDLASFPLLDGTAFAAADHAAGAPADVHASFRPCWQLPVRVRAGWSMVHDAHDGLAVSRTRLSGRLTLGRGSMVVRSEGHLGFLVGRRPFAALQLSDLQVTFGA